jgi:hypothetical protein
LPPSEDVLGFAHMDVEDDRAFLTLFEAAAIPADAWTHRDHVRVAFLYLRERPFAQALDGLRTGIQALNRANRVQDTPTSGYHETITVAWTRLVAAALASSEPIPTFTIFAQRHPALLHKTRLRDFYSRDLLTSPEARSTFIEPDLASLPPLP